MLKHKLSSILIAVLSSVLFCACSAGSARSQAESDGRDSLSDAEYIQKIAFTEPDRALSLLDSMEVEKSLSPFEINDLRSMVYHNGFSQYRLAYSYALKAYRDPDAAKYPEKRLALIDIMAQQCHNNGDYAGSVALCAEGLALAGQQGDRTAEAELHVSWGLNMLELEQYDEAVSHIDRAIGILQEEARREPGYRTWDGLFYALGMKLSLLWDTDRYEEALTLRPLLEEALAGLAASPDTPDGCVDMRRAETDVCYCCIAYSMGRKAEGDSLYRQVVANPYVSTPDGEYLNIPCLLMAKRYDEALHYLRREKRLLQETTDTVNWDYINPHLQMELEAWQGKKNWQEASRVQGVMLALTDSVRKRERDADALELAELYKSEEKDARIKKKEKEADLWMVISAAAILLLVAAGGFTAVIIRKYREISMKNSSLTARLNEMLSFRDEALRKQEEILALQEQVAQTPEEDTDIDRRIFYRIKYEIEKQNFSCKRTSTRRRSRKR